MADSSIQADLASWRIIPYPASGSDVIGTALTISRQYAPFLEALRVAGENDNLPIITHALSAPLVGILGLSHVLKPSPGKPFVAIFQYPWFTTLAFFNEHADLRLIRTLQHRGLRRPTNFRNALATTNASLEFVDPDLFLVPSGNQVDTTLSAELQITFATSRVEIVQPPTAGEVPGWCAEPVIAVELLGTPAQSGEPLSHTFAMMRNERWALQNFLPTPPEILERFPVKGDMRLLKFLKLGRVALFLFVVLAVAYFGYGALQIVSSPEWAFDLSQAEMAKGRLAKLAIERKKAEHWNNLLDDRSKAWTALESLSRMFPENGGMLVDTYSHSAKPDTKPGTEKLGFSKDWKITGFARDEALEYLNNLNTREGMAAHFSEIARITGNPSYNPNTGSRSLLVNVRTQENGGYKPLPPEEISHSDKATYPFTFDLTITQRFESTDPMALSVAKAP